MNKIIAKTGSGLITAVLLTSLMPAIAMADTSVDVSGNGTGSHNKVTVHNSNKTSLKQSNNSYIQTGISSSTGTGGNSANHNTGGDTGISTGDATSTIAVGVGGSTNTLSSDLLLCGCQNGLSDVTVSGNGDSSHNKVSLNNSSSLKLSQSNDSTVLTEIDSKTGTGGNKANGNTGGSTGIGTGDATSSIGVTVTGSSNSQ